MLVAKLLQVCVCELCRFMSICCHTDLEAVGIRFVGSGRYCYIGLEYISSLNPEHPGAYTQTRKRGFVRRFQCKN